MKHMYRGLWYFVLGLIIGAIPLFFAKLSHAQEAVPARPTSHYVLDQTNTLSAPEIAKIDQIAKEVETNKKVSVAVLMITSTNGEDIAQYARRVAEQWKPGVDGVGKGALVVIAKNDHKSRIETSKNLEGEVPDATARNILTDAGAHFKRGQFGEGLHDIVRDIGAKTGVIAAVVAEPSVEVTDVTSFVLTLLGLLGVVGSGAFFVHRSQKKAEEERRKYMLEQEKHYRDAEHQRFLARQARERMEEANRAAASMAVSSINFAPAYAAPLAATAGLSGAQIRQPLNIKKSPEPPKPAPKPVKKEEPKRSTRVYDDTPSYIPSYSNYSSSSRSSSSDDSSSSSSSWSSSSSSSDFGGGGSSSDW